MQQKSVFAKGQLTERIAELRARFSEWMKSIDRNRLVFIDEAGSTVAGVHQSFCGQAIRMSREESDAPKSPFPSRSILSQAQA